MARCSTQDCKGWVFSDGLCRKCQKAIASASPEDQKVDENDPTFVWEKLRIKQRVEVVPLVGGYLSESDVGADAPRAPGTVRVVCISDTHSHHQCEGHTHPPPAVPAGDILVHAGDFSYGGKRAEVESFVSFLDAQPHATKIVIAGNHDITLHAQFYDACDRSRFGHASKEDCEELRALLEAHCTYLEDKLVESHGLKIYGSPWQPEFCDWAFNLPRGDPIRRVWQKIPEGIDILVTHGPPLGHGDLCSGGNRAGCADLLHEVQSRVRPRYHVFGHVHEGYGATSDGQTTFINASTCTFQYKPTNPAVVVDVSLRSA
eukprot:TRINITY_DN74341_c0_g1_i1.p1 TRINITY_DN74341_c0_g1~~TRINITY_DN74341_c0_g1_i1.p1  ORF type:complete len:317 (+),score=38.87 TRINITY_DN74341_c0_g1_i1:26-976(+)